MRGRTELILCRTFVVGVYMVLSQMLNLPSRRTVTLSTWLLITFATYTLNIFCKRTRRASTPSHTRSYPTPNIPWWTSSHLSFLEPLKTSTVGVCQNDSLDRCWMLSHNFWAGNNIRHCQLARLESGRISDLTHQCLKMFMCRKNQSRSICVVRRQFWREGWCPLFMMNNRY